MGHNSMTVTDQNFQAEVLQSDKPVLVDDKTLENMFENLPDQDYRTPLYGDTPAQNSEGAALDPVTPKPAE